MLLGNAVNSPIDIIDGYTILYHPPNSILIFVTGNYSLWGSGAPLMNKVYLDSSKRIANPSADEVAQNRPTVFDTWVHRYPDANYPTKPK